MAFGQLSKPDHEQPPVGLVLPVQEAGRLLMNGFPGHPVRKNPSSLARF
jgi:hypothetical protein